MTFSIIEGNGFTDLVTDVFPSLAAAFEGARQRVPRSLRQHVTLQALPANAPGESDAPPITWTVLVRGRPWGRTCVTTNAGGIPRRAGV